MVNCKNLVKTHYQNVEQKCISKFFERVNYILLTLNLFCYHFITNVYLYYKYISFNRNKYKLNIII